MAMKRRSLLGFLIVLIACDSTVESQLESQLWKELDIRSYQFEYTVACFCSFTGPNPALITVRQGQVTKVESADGTMPLPGVQTADYPTIDSLFALVERQRAAAPNVLKVEYDETYHFPKSIFIDPVDRIADDEVTYKVDHFTLLSPSQ